MKLKAEIDDRLAKVEYQQRDGRRIIKTIPTESLCQVLTQEGQSESSLDIIPKGLRMTAKVPGKTMLCFERPAGKYPVSISPSNGQTPSVFECDMPHALTLAEFRTDSGQLVYTRIYQFASKVPFFGLETPLFAWPLPNTYDDGHCCVGNMQARPYSSVQEAREIFDLFHSGTYNGDLSGNRFQAYAIPGSSTAAITRCFDLYKYLSENKVQFPMSILRPMFTVKDLLERAGYGSIL